MGIIYEKEFSMKKTILDEKLYNLYFITNIEITRIKDSY